MSGPVYYYNDNGNITAEENAPAATAQGARTSLDQTNTTASGSHSGIGWDSQTRAGYGDQMNTGNQGFSSKADEPPYMQMTPFEFYQHVMRETATGCPEVPSAPECQAPTPQDSQRRRGFSSQKSKQSQTRRQREDEAVRSFFDDAAHNMPQRGNVHYYQDNSTAAPATGRSGGAGSGSPLLK